MNADELRATDKAVIEVGDALGVLPLAERSLRRALAPGGDLEDLALRVGRRCFIKVSALRERLGLIPDMDEPGSPNPGCVTDNDEIGPRRDGSRLHVAG